MREIKLTLWPPPVCSKCILKAGPQCFVQLLIRLSLCHAARTSKSQCAVQKYSTIEMCTGDGLVNSEDLSHENDLQLRADSFNVFASEMLSFYWLSNIYNVCTFLILAEEMLYYLQLYNIARRGRRIAEICSRRKKYQIQD